MSFRPAGPVRLSRPEPVIGMMDTLVVAAFAVVVLLEIAVPLGLGYWMTRRFGVSWKIFALGAGCFVAVQIIHTPLVLLTQGPLYLYLEGIVPDQSMIIAVLAVYLGLLAGSFEETGRYLVFRFWFPKNKIALSRDNGLIFGAGWGGIESIIVALLVLSSMVSYIVLSRSPDPLAGLSADPAVMAQVNALLALTPAEILPGLFERMMTITLHIAWSILVLAAVVYREKRLLLLAVLWHAAVDFFAVYLGQTEGILAAELSLALFAVLGLVVLRREWRRLETAPAAE
jgi:uncharacterized membrane protein YhfC